MNTTVFRDKPTQGSYHAVRADGSVLAQGADPGPVLQAALDRSLLDDPASGPGAGTVEVRAGLYRFTAGFTGLSVRSHGTLRMDPAALLEVPSGYTGAAIVLDSHDDGGTVVEVQHARVSGGLLREAAPRSHAWTAIALRARSQHQLSGVLFNRIQDVMIYEPAVGIALQAPGATAFITSNKFDFVTVWRAAVGIDFTVRAGYTLGVETSGILYNTFADVALQSGADRYTVGIRGVTGVGNHFTGTTVWDAPHLPAMTIAPTALRTTVLGGSLAGERPTHPTYVDDNGSGTVFV